MKKRLNLTKKLMIGLMINFGVFTACQQEEFAPEVKIDEIANDYDPKATQWYWANNWKTHIV